MHGVMVKVLMEEEVPCGATTEMVQNRQNQGRNRVLFVFLTESQSNNKSIHAEKYFLGHWVICFIHYTTLHTHTHTRARTHTYIHTCARHTDTTPPCARAPNLTDCTWHNALTHLELNCVRVVSTTVKYTHCTAERVYIVTNKPPRKAVCQKIGNFIPTIVSLWICQLHTHTHTDTVTQ